MTAVRIVAGVGTDHHPFPRLMDWLESWVDAHPDTELTVQHGATRPCRNATNVAMADPADLVVMYGSADAVVLQGGPGGIMDARQAGRTPIVVPRLAALGEVVDDHQVDFTHRLARQGLIRLAESEAELHDALRQPPPPIAADSASAPGVAAGSRVLAQLPQPLSREERRRRRRWSARHVAGALRGH